MKEKIKKGDIVYLGKDEWIVNHIINGSKKKVLEIARLENNGIDDVLALFPDLIKNPEIIYRVVAEDEVFKKN